MTNNELQLAGQLDKMTDEELLLWSRTPRPFDPTLNVARIILREFKKRGLK